MPCAAVGLSLYNPTASVTLCQTPTPKLCNFYDSSAVTPSSSRKLRGSPITCRATPSNSPSPITDFDLYDLLGIDTTSDLSQIKMAYRALQKRCHPDIAGAPGHDMAIILNQAYSVLSNPHSRLAYDKEISKTAQLRGYTGKPIYSTWFGSESEQRALFVDEVKCVGCLKCALFADKTFAIESAYGRARVVAQWADPEYKVQEAIDACPVNCISMVERSDLAALEFLMSKQPRGNVRVGVGNAVGARVSNIFVDAKKFQNQFQDATNKGSAKCSKTDARIAAVQAIRSISNWLYWQVGNKGNPTAQSGWALTHVHGKLKSPQPNINKLREAAAAKNQGRKSTPLSSQSRSHYIQGEEYWVPAALPLPTTTGNNVSSVAAANSSSSPQWTRTADKNNLASENKPEKKPLMWAFPVGTAATAAIVVQSWVGEDEIGRLQEHVGGSVALEIVNSALLQVMLASLTWYFVGVAMVGLIESLRSSSTGK